MMKRIAFLVVLMLLSLTATCQFHLTPVNSQEAARLKRQTGWDDTSGQRTSVRSDYTEEEKQANSPHNSNNSRWDEIEDESEDRMRAISEGRLLPSLDYIKMHIPTLLGTATYNTKLATYELYSICNGDFNNAVNDKINDMDELDKAIYMQSEEFKSDQKKVLTAKEEAVAAKNKICAFVWELGGCNTVFTTKGVQIMPPLSKWKNETRLTENHICIKNIAIPVQPSVQISNDSYFFSCSDLMTLKRIKDGLINNALVILFKPAFAKEVYDIDKREGVAFVNPISMYIVDHEGNVLIDLRNQIRSISSKSDHAAEIAYIENINTNANQVRKLKKEQQEKEIKEFEEKLQKDLAKMKYHEIPREVRCLFCGGRGETTVEIIGGGWQKQRCIHCYGRGYVKQHYY